MRPSRPLLIAALVVLALTIGCSVKETISHPACEGDGSWIIVAQSVPTASQVPCLDPIPRGWDIDTVEIDDTGTVITFGSDRAGTVAARMRFAESCDVGEAVSTPTEYPDTERFESVVRVAGGFEAVRYYRFDGGCVTWEFEFDEGARSALSIELGNAMQLFDRDELQQILADSFLDEEL